MLAPVPPGLTSALPGGEAALRVEFPVGEALYTRATPLFVRLTSPWGTASGAATGTPAPNDPVHYFGQLDPLVLRVAVPPGVKSGRYRLHLSTELYLCSKRAGQCYRRSVEAEATVVVGGQAASVPLRLPASLLGPGF